MRTLFTLILTGLLCTSLQAQVAPGDKFLGGRLNFSYGNQTSNGITVDGSSFSFSISPRMGFLIKDNLAVGMVGTFAYAKQPNVFFLSSNNPNNPILLSGESIIQYGIGPFLRHYTPFSESAGLTVDFYTEIGGGNIEQNTTGSIRPSSSLFNLSVGVLPSFYYFFSPHFCLEASFGGLNYLYSRAKEKEAPFEPSITKSSNLNLTLASQLGISFNYYFLKK